MAMEELPGTKYLSVFRVPLTDFVDPLSRNGGGVALSQHPSRYFRNQRGFYVRQRFCEAIGRQLQVRSSRSKEEYLFVGILKHGCVWQAAQHMIEGKSRPVPWWVIKPLLLWQTSLEAGALLPSGLPTLFCMEVMDKDDDTPLMFPASLSLQFGALHTEWHLDLLDDAGRNFRCHEGQVLLAVA